MFVGRNFALNVLPGQLNLFLLQLEHDLKQVAHRQHHLAGRFVGFDAEKPVATVGGTKNIAKCTRVRHVLGDERYFVHGMVIERILRRKAGLALGTGRNEVLLLGWLHYLRQFFHLSTVIHRS